MGKWTRFDHFEANIFDALDKLNDLIDESDGDTQLPNIVHAFQVDLLTYLFRKRKQVSDTNPFTYYYRQPRG